MALYTYHRFPLFFYFISFIRDYFLLKARAFILLQEYLLRTENLLPLPFP